MHQPARPGLGSFPFFSDLQELNKPSPFPSKQALSVIAVGAGSMRPKRKSAKESDGEEALTRAAGIQRAQEMVNASAKKLATWFFVADVAYSPSFPQHRDQCRSRLEAAGGGRPELRARGGPSGVPGSDELRDDPLGIIYLFSRNAHIRLVMLPSS